MSTKTGMKRLLKEYKDIQQKPNPDVRLVPTDPDCANLREWDAYLRGPIDSPYEGGIYHLRVSVPETYPISPPKFQFVTRVCHPNIHFKTGEICLDVLASNWSPAWTLSSMCDGILSLLTTPDETSPLNCDAGNLLRCGDIRGYKSLVRMYSDLYAASVRLPDGLPPFDST